MQQISRRLASGLERTDHDPPGLSPQARDQASAQERGFAAARRARDDQQLRSVRATQSVEDSQILGDLLLTSEKHPSIFLVEGYEARIGAEARRDGKPVARVESRT